MRSFERYDVAVVGGGFAGIAAAVSAAAAGARTVLLERDEVLGGNASCAFVHTVCGLYHAAGDGDAVPLNPGFATRFAAVLRAGGAAGVPERAGKVWVLPTEPVRIPDVTQRVCAAQPNLDVVCGAAGADANLDGNAGFALAWQPPQGERVIAVSKLLLDTTGGAFVAQRAGAAVERTPPEQRQLASYIVRLAGVDTEALAGFGRMRVTAAVAGGVRAGKLPPECESVLVRPGGEPGTAYLTLTLPRALHAGVALDEGDARSKLEEQARSLAERVVSFLRDRPELARAEVDAWPRRIGVRESATLAGAERIEAAHVREGRRHADAVARSSWPIELWHAHRGAEFDYPEGACDVPLGALVSATHPRIGAAGRCLSATHEALGALRVLGTALASGEALGTAAALAADAGTSLADVAPERVRAEIRERTAKGSPA